MLGVIPFEKDPDLSGTSTSATLDQWTNGLMDLCTDGHLTFPCDPVYETNGPMDQWTNGPMDQRTNGPMDQWTNGLMYH